MKKMLRLLPVILVFFGTASAFPANNESYALEWYQLLNEYRAQEWESQLVWNQDLANCAKAYWAKQIIEWFSNHYWTPSHPTTATTRCADANLVWIWENLIGTTHAFRSPAKAMQLWKDSPHHNENLLYKPYTMVGIAAVWDPTQKISRWVQVFAIWESYPEEPFTTITVKSPWLEQENKSWPNLAFRDIEKMSNVMHWEKEYLRLHMTLDFELDNTDRRVQLWIIAKRLRSFFRDM
jgi:uncharacterized protein YkwD